MNYTLKDKRTKFIADYIHNRGISVRNVSKNTGLPYTRLLDSLGAGREFRRPLTADEYVKTCGYLNIDIDELE